MSDPFLKTIRRSFFSWLLAVEDLCLGFLTDVRPVTYASEAY